MLKTNKKHPCASEPWQLRSYFYKNKSVNKRNKNTQSLITIAVLKQQLALFLLHMLLLLVGLQLFTQDQRKGQLFP